jgi:hypothetical protein
MHSIRIAGKGILKEGRYSNGKRLMMDIIPQCNTEGFSQRDTERDRRMVKAL